MEWNSLLRWVGKCTLQFTPFIALSSHYNNFIPYTAKTFWEVKFCSVSLRQCLLREKWITYASINSLFLCCSTCSLLIFNQLCRNRAYHYCSTPTWTKCCYMFVRYGIQEATIHSNRTFCSVLTREIIFIFIFLHIFSALRQSLATRNTDENESYIQPL